MKNEHPGSVRAVIIDDDAFSRISIRKQLERFTEAVTVVAECTDGPEGLAAIAAHAPDLVFLDIQMRGMDGFAMLDALPRRDFGVIFTTSHDAYAIRAIRYSALDYLLKPIRSSEFDAALGHFIANRIYLPARLEHLVSTTKELGAPRVLVVPLRDGDKHLSVDDIVRCESDRNYTCFHLADGERVVSSHTLTRFEEFLSESDFLRIHRSHIINVRHIQGLAGDDEVRMSDGASLEISRRRKAEVIATIRASVAQSKLK